MCGCEDCRVVDASEVRRIESDMRAAGWASHTSLDREVRSWNRLAAEVNTYEATVDDYTNDLCSRDYLEEFASRASDDLRANILERIAGADEMYAGATVEDTEGLLGEYYRIDLKDGWWWRRRPSSGPLAGWLTR